MGKLDKQSRLDVCKPYEKTELWRHAFENEQSPTAKSLASAYSTAWERASTLASRIAADAPGLTLHNEQHFAALWRCADLLTYSDLKLTPVELFVFGSAVLIHDAAHTTVAYEGGIEEIAQTDQWADNLAAALPEDAKGRSLPLLNELTEQVREHVLFNTVRDLHALQSPKLISRPFRHPSFGSDYYLLDEPTLRNHFGDIIGRIAASHHWNLSEVATIPAEFNAPFPYQEFGPVRSRLIACLMRTTDAIQIDSSRATDFEYAIAAPTGTSKAHWEAQNRLTIGVSPEDENSLVVETTAPFQESEAMSWWIAYDLARTAHKELSEVDALLRDCQQPRLALKRVGGISSPDQFSKLVRAQDWTPIDAEVKVGDTGKVVSLLGGKGLYGDDPVVPLRELLQNAVDAVRARRLVDSDYSGKVTVRVEPASSQDDRKQFVLRVSDDGIGMSPAILTGPFLTFGDTGWTSSELKRERAGFLGKNFNHIGRFGIGFFSVFMIGQAVKVKSRPYDKSADAARELTFNSGLGLRPILKQARFDSMNVSTTIEVTIDEETLNQILFKSPGSHVATASKPRAKPTKINYSLSALLGVICPAIDVRIDFSNPAEDENGSIEGNWIDAEAVDWLCRINDIERDVVPQVILDNPELVELVGTRSAPRGRAALSPTNRRLGVNAVGGFSEKLVASRERKTGIVGVMARRPSGPKRATGDLEDEVAVRDWATRQVESWSKLEVTEEERNYLACHAAAYKADASSLANAIVDGKWHSLDEVYARLSGGSTLVAPIEMIGFDENKWRIRSAVNELSGWQHHPEDIEVELDGVITAGGSKDIDPYWRVPDDEHGPLTFLGMLGRHCEAHGSALAFEGQNTDFGFYKGQTVKRQRLEHGDRIVVPGLKIWLV